MKADEGAGKRLTRHHTALSSGPVPDGPDLRGRDKPELYKTL